MVYISVLFSFCIATLKLSKFHQSLLTEFEPLVEKYLDDLDNGIKKDMQGFFERETWMPVT